MHLLLRASPHNAHPAPSLSHKVEEIIRATVAPAVEDGAADWLAAVHAAKDIFNVWLPPVLGLVADETR